MSTLLEEHTTSKHDKPDAEADAYNQGHKQKMATVKAPVGQAHSVSQPSPSNLAR